MSCSTESLVPSWISIGVGSLMLIFLTATSVYSYKLLKNTNGWNDKGFKDKIKLWATDIWGRKSCYLPIISHLADTTTDFAAVAEFYIIADTTTRQQCGGLNIWYLFGLSISCMVTYRMISSYVIYILTKSWKRVFTQFIDIELFRILYVSHKYKLSKSSSPQRLISTLEAVFEAAPQALIQFIFLMKTDGLSIIIMFSVVLSLLNLTSSAVSDDKMLVFTKDSFSFRSDGWKTKLKKISVVYLFRFCDIPSQILCLCLFWVFIHGYALTIIICIDFLIVIIFYWKTNKYTDALMGLIALPLSFSEEYMITLFLFWFYRVLWVISVNVTLWIYVPLYLSSTQQSVFIIALWCFASFASIIKFPLLLVLQKVVGDDWYKTTKQRANMPALCQNNLFEDVIELMFYIHSSPKSSDLIMSIDNKPYATLLCIVYKVCDNRNDSQLFDTIFEKHGVDLCDNELCDTALHAICEHNGKFNAEQKCILTEKLLKNSTMKYLKQLNHKGQSVFMLLARSVYDEADLSICDLIWDKFNELCAVTDKNELDKEDEVDLIENVNDAKIKYLNTHKPIGVYTGWHVLQFAVNIGGDGVFFKKFLSLYPSEDSKRDIIFRTDFPDCGSLLISCVENYNEKCYDILWEEMDNFCSHNDNANEVKINYLNAQKSDSDENALMIALNKIDMAGWSLSAQLNVHHTVSDWFFRILNLYPTLRSKREALKITNKEGKNALDVCKANDWNDKEKTKTIRMIESILNEEVETENIGGNTMNNIFGLKRTGVSGTEPFEAMLHLYMKNKATPNSMNQEVALDINYEK